MIITKEDEQILKVLNETAIYCANTSCPKCEFYTTTGCQWENIINTLASDKPHSWDLYSVKKIMNEEHIDRKENSCQTQTYKQK